MKPAKHIHRRIPALLLMIPLLLSVCCLSASQEACGRVLWVDELYIRPQFRGLGLGTAFFKFLEGCDGYDYIRLEVEKDNHKAMKLYTSLGFKDAEYTSLYKKTKVN